MDKKVVIIGAGPCGLGAAIRLQQLGYRDWILIEKEPSFGGLACSFKDTKGFSWDVGGHVIFSHYKFFNELADAGMIAYANKLLDKSLYKEDITNVANLWCSHKRESWIRYTPDNWIEYPFQNHFFSQNDHQVTKECFEGIQEANRFSEVNRNYKPTNFEDWINRVFGKGLAKHFMYTYNFKVWGYYPSEMNADWVGERVATVDFSRTLDNYINFNRADLPEKINENALWGPNSTFRYPKFGGTGAIWEGVGSLLDSSNVKLNAQVELIDTENKTVVLKNHKTLKYDYLISTLPIDLLLSQYTKPTSKLDVNKITKLGRPIHSSTHVVGLGFNGKSPDHLASKSWMYFPSNRSDFYRSTVLSNYSPYMVSEPGKQWSLMFEICESEHRQVTDEVIERTIVGAVKENLINEEQINEIESKWHLRMEYGYPTPYLKRNQFLNSVEPILKKELNIYSRGRFGGWKYEVSNQDHSLMQGVEAVDNILFGCEEQTYFYPDHVNSRKETTQTFKY